MHLHYLGGPVHYLPSLGTAPAHPDGAAQRVAGASMTGTIEAFRAAILAALGHAPDVIEPGRFHRFGTTDRRSDSAGWCKLFADLRGGVFGCYRQGISEMWSAADRATLTR